MYIIYDHTAHLCVMKSKYKSVPDIYIEKFRKKHGKFDLLLTQFSYAAWKGNEDNKLRNAVPFS